MVILYLDGGIIHKETGEWQLPTRFPLFGDVSPAPLLPLQIRSLMDTDGDTN